jgi:hypothetical protein
MSAVNLLLAGLGGGITLMVVIGMFLLTPRGVEPNVEAPHEQPRPREESEVDLDPEVVPNV